MRPQARAARFYNKISSYQNFSCYYGWARPIYINHHPQPPAKYIRFSGISQSLYTRVKIRLTDPGTWDIVGSMIDTIKKGLDLTYLRGQVVALMKLSANIQSTINKLEEEIKEGENEK